MFHALLAEFYKLTGCPVLANTSFNVRNEPIVCTPADAYRCFVNTEMDMLVLEDCVVEKSNADRRGLLSKPQPPTVVPRAIPSTRQLREFAAIGAIILCVLAIWLFASRGSLALAACYAAGAVVAGWLGLARPRWFAPLFTTWLVLTFPIAWIVSTCVLAIIFYALVTPLGLLFRLMGRDVLDRRLRSDQNSYWQTKHAAENPERYLRQF